MNTMNINECSKYSESMNTKNINEYSECYDANMNTL